MNQTTKPEIWPIDKPFIIFMLPGFRAVEYASAMNQLVVSALHDLGWDVDDIDLLGFIAATPQHGAEGIYFLEDSGVDTRSISLIMLWGETAGAVDSGNIIPEECGIGTVVLPATGAIIPTLRMPTLDYGWWDDPLHLEYAVTVFANMIRDVRYERDGTEPVSFMTLPATWN